MENIVFYGFTDNMPPMKRGKVEKSLTKCGKYERIRMDGKVYSYPEFVRALLQKPEARLSIEEDVPGWWNGRETKPKTRYFVWYTEQAEHGIIHPGTELTKTQYEFAEYLQAAGLVSDEAAAAWRAEADRKAAEAAEAAKRAEQEAEDRLKERNQFEAWITEEAARLWISGDPRVAIIQKIYEEKLGFTSPRQAQLIVAIDHCSQSNCRDWLGDCLGNIHNKASRKAFTALTGIKLPAGMKNTLAFIDSLSDAEWTQVLHQTSNAG